MKAMRWVQIAITGLALLALVVTPSPALVEQYFGRGLYPGLQQSLTAWSNQTGVALFDFITITLGFVVIGLLGHALRAAIRARSIRPAFRGGWTIVSLGSVVYLWFLLAWGLNYGRPPLETMLPYERGKVTPEAVQKLAQRAVDEVNRLHASGHAHGFPSAAEMPPALVQSFHRVEQRLGRPALIVPGRPKRTVFASFFRSAGVDGMHAPFVLETLLNPDLTAPERPAVLAHEWAHLAGYAPEDEASFVGLVAAMGADPASRYSAWLALLHEVAALLPRDDQLRVLGALDEGPRRDREAIYRRQLQRVEFISQASWHTYDQYLKTQGVTEGVASYSRVVGLFLGTGAVDW
jgi:hypothetical protein